VDKLTALAKNVLSPKTGILRSIKYLPWEPAQIRLQHPIGKVPNYSVLPCGGDISRPGGSSADFESGLAKVIFEGLERYSAAFVDYDELIKSKPPSDKYIHGGRYPLFAEEQYLQDDWPFRPLTKDSEIYWCSATSLFDNQEYYIPATQIFLPYRPGSAEECLGPSTSTGMAAGWTKPYALLNGVMEVVERDSLMIMWQNQLSMPHIKLPDNSPAAAIIEESLVGTNAQLTLIDISSNLKIPTVLAVLKHKAFGKELTTVGLSAKPDYETAVLKAFFEAVSDYERIRVHLDQNGEDYWRPKADFSDVTDFEWHGLSYISPEMQQHLEFVLASDQSIELRPEMDVAGETIEELLMSTLNLLKPHVEDVVAVNIATRDVESLGVHVQKVSIPQLIPLNPDHRFPWLGHKRLYQAPVDMGYFNQPKSMQEMNSMPHPFS